MQFFRVQVGVQSPAAITTTRLVLRRFSDFVSLFSEVCVFSTLHSIFLLFPSWSGGISIFFFFQLKTEFPMKNLPPPPPKKMLRIKSHALLEEVGI